MYGVAFVEEPLVVELAEQPPQTFDVGVFVGYIWVFHVYPVSHPMAKIFPFSGIHHYVLAAFAVVILHAHLVSDVLLGYAEFFLHSKFYRKTMGVPSGLSVNLVALHRFVSAKCVLDGACHHMVYAGMSVCRGRSFKKYVGRTVCTLRDAAVEKVHLVPLGKHFHVDCWEVELTMLGECLAHICFLFLEMF